jgi:hypothetical protein
MGFPSLDFPGARDSLQRVLRFSFVNAMSWLARSIEANQVKSRLIANTVAAEHRFCSRNPPSCPVARMDQMTGRLEGTMFRNRDSESKTHRLLSSGAKGRKGYRSDIGFLKERKRILMATGR